MSVEADLTVCIRVAPRSFKSEAIHELLWYHLLNEYPGMRARVLDCTELNHEESTDWANQVRVELQGSAGAASDLFGVCNTCNLDRLVIEVKGPQAQFNTPSTGKNAGVPQTKTYRKAYGKKTTRCGCVRHRTPLFVVLDARNRSRRRLEQAAGYGLDGWHTVGYNEILGNKYPVAIDAAFHVLLRGQESTRA